MDGQLLWFIAMFGVAWDSIIICFEWNEYPEQLLPYVQRICFIIMCLSLESFCFILYFFLGDHWYTFPNCEKNIKEFFIIPLPFWFFIYWFSYLCLFCIRQGYCDYLDIIWIQNWFLIFAWLLKDCSVSYAFWHLWCK